MSKSKFWCFTENDNPNSFRNSIEARWDEWKSEVTFICGQLEVASTGQRHFQGYIQLRVSKPLSWLRNNISATAHWEIQRGTAQQAYDYTKKNDETTVADTFLEKGTFVAGKGGAGARTDIHNFVNAIKSGATQRELIEDETQVEVFAKYIKLHDRVRSLYPMKRKSEEFKVSLYYGAPGTGKTRKAKDENPDIFEVPISNGTLWLDGYDGHEVVLWDDFMGKGSKMSLDNTLKYLDRYSRQVPIKGSHTWYIPNHVIVTSNYHPRAWYNWENRGESWKALCRRFHEVIVFEETGEQVTIDPEEFLNDFDLWPQEKQKEITGRIGFENYE